MPVEQFLAADPANLIGKLTLASAFDVELPQREAWERTIAVLKNTLPGIVGYLYLEFDVPRLGSRIDAVLLSEGIIFPIEFKVGEKKHHRSDLNQAWDYALDLKNFHQASHTAPILPILVATEAGSSDEEWKPPHADGVRPPFATNATNLRDALRIGFALEFGIPIVAEEWGRAPYHPTPTIIEAAQSLYARHSVEAISRSDAGAKNLSVTSLRVEAVIDQMRTEGGKAIVFVTGVPGAGKTLVGLNVATQRSDEESPGHAVFLSGNGPLVAVLREALIRDEMTRRKAAGETSVRKGEVGQKVKPFIQNVHHFRDDGLRDEALPPHDHVVIFDEAQRAWNRAKTSDFMRRRKGRTGFDQSEPEFLISYLDRHSDWAVVVCLVGGGQEIHTGEAGIAAWLEAIKDRFTHWRVFISPALRASEYAALEAIKNLQMSAHVELESALHLATSIRSFRSERVSEFVRAVLDCDTDSAKELMGEVIEHYPVVITRDLDRAKEWVRKSARGTERYGLVASSQAQRLKPHAIDVRVDVNPIHWFLNPADDTRSSWYLEDAATEFQVQGLELDWVCMTWDADLRFTDSGWRHHQFRGSAWQQVHKADRQRYLVNAYRVLLTRARQGMAIFIPLGSQRDPTRLPVYYNPTYEYLRAIGIPELA